MSTATTWVHSEMNYEPTLKSYETALLVFLSNLLSSVLLSLAVPSVHPPRWQSGVSQNQRSLQLLSGWEGLYHVITQMTRLSINMTEHGPSFFTCDPAYSESHPWSCDPVPPSPHRHIQHFPIHDQLKFASSPPPPPSHFITQKLDSSPFRLCFSRG